jgi:hypothetical protein
MYAEAMGEVFSVPGEATGSHAEPSVTQPRRSSLRLPRASFSQPGSSRTAADPFGAHVEQPRRSSLRIERASVSQAAPSGAQVEPSSAPVQQTRSSSFRQPRASSSQAAPSDTQPKTSKKPSFGSRMLGGFRFRKNS